jgi:hypothetical protein
MIFHETDNLALTQHIIPVPPIWIQLWLDYIKDEAN